MSLHDWQMGGLERTFVGLGQLQGCWRPTRAFWRRSRAPCTSRCWASCLPLLLGVFAAEVFHQRFPLRGLLRGIYIVPMMTTPVAIALVFIMMMHPQLGVLNYLLSLVGLPTAVVGLQQGHGHRGARPG